MSIVPVFPCPITALSSAGKGPGLIALLTSRCKGVGIKVTTYVVLSWLIKRASEMYSI